MIILISSNLNFVDICANMFFLCSYTSLFWLSSLFCTKRWCIIAWLWALLRQQYRSQIMAIFANKQARRRLLGNLILISMHKLDLTWRTLYIFPCLEFVINCLQVSIAHIRQLVWPMDLVSFLEFLQELVWRITLRSTVWGFLLLLVFFNGWRSWADKFDYVELADLTRRLWVVGEAEA